MLKIYGLRRAFTLAEVLITLGIIGVVAALTMPILINKINNQTTITKLKKEYSVLSQVLQRAKADNADFDTWDLVDNNAAKTTEAFEKYVKPYIKTINHCTDRVAGCWAQSSELNNTPVGTEAGIGSQINAFILPDGATVVINIYSSENDRAKFGITDNKLNPFLGFFVDVNGVKLPNKLGEDIFAFILTHKGLVPAGIDNDSADCNRSSHGYTCAAKILNENAINY